VTIGPPPGGQHSTGGAVRGGGGGGGGGGILSIDAYNALERGMSLREMADYKETYSQSGAENLIQSVVAALQEIENKL